MENAAGEGGQAQSDGDLTGQPIRGETSLSVADFKSAWIELPAVRKMIAWMVVAIVVIPLATSLRSPDTLWVSLLATPILLVALGFGLVRGRARWASAALSGSDAKVVTYLFDGSGYHVAEPGRQSHLEWSTLHGHAEIEGAFLIYTTPQIVTLVPKRALTPADQARLRHELAARIPRRTLGGGGGSVKKTLLLWGLLILAFVAIWQFLNPKN